MKLSVALQILMSQLDEDTTEETSNNTIVPVDKSLARYAREAALRDWYPTTPVLTEEERKMFIGRSTT
jgi:hypothetical protein